MSIDERIPPGWPEPAKNTDINTVYFGYPVGHCDWCRYNQERTIQLWGVFAFAPLYLPPFPLPPCIQTNKQEDRTAAMHRKTVTARICTAQPTASSPREK